MDLQGTNAETTFVIKITERVHCLMWKKKKRKKTLSSQEFKSKGFELFDHSDMPVLCSLSKMLNCL